VNRSLLLRVAGALLALFVAGCGSDPGVRLAPLARDARILAFGDSLTFGYGASEAESYPVQLGRLLDRRVIRSGVPGETSEEGLARLPHELDRSDPALLLLCLGGNDFLRRQDEARTEANLARMIELARERGVAVVLVGVPRLSLISSLRGAELYTRLAQRYGVPLQNDVIADVLSERELLHDRIHPNARGYLRIAEAIRDLLRDAGAV
jgi:acyl-CoA thioesterase-1